MGGLFLAELGEQHAGRADRGERVDRPLAGLDGAVPPIGSNIDTLGLMFSPAAMPIPP